jgi:hypothetical protein
MPQQFHYLTCCVHSTAELIDAMTGRAQPITLRTFARHCNWRPWARMMGYQVGSGRDLQLRNDRHVRYYRSTFDGQPCYYAQHSAIEYIFVRPQQGLS